MKNLLTFTLSPGNVNATSVSQSADLIRLSVGIEDAGDIIADIDQALYASQK